MKKILYIPLDYQIGAQKDLFEGLCNFFETKFYSGVSDAINFCPDYIYVQSNVIPATELSQIKDKTNAFIFQWTGDCREDLLPDVMAYKDVCDLTLLACGLAQKDMYEEALNHPVLYLQHGVANWSFRDVDLSTRTNYDIKFIGNAYNHFSGAIERNELCKILSAEFESFEVIGSGFNLPEFRNSRTVPFKDVFDIYNKSYIGISSSIFNDKKGYWSNRTLDIMASGTCCLVRYVDKLEETFTDMVDCVFFYSNQDAVDKIKMLIENENLRNEIAQNGQRKVANFHTYIKRAEEIKLILESFNNGNEG